MKRCIILIAVALLIAVGAQALWAQQKTATLRGTVKTVDGLAIADVAITATNTETGITWSATSDQRGKYFLLTLTPGTYNIKLSKDQYKEKVYEGIVLSIGQEILLNLEIEPGTFEDVIVIQGETPLIEPTKSTVSTLIAEEFIKSIPTKSRSFHDLAFLAPGVVQNNKWGLGTAQSVSGMRGFSNTFILDGVSNDEAAYGSTATYVGQDTIQEFDVITHMAPAEFGQATGGIFNIATRSGTNEFHGSVSTFYRDESLQEKDYFADEKAPFSRMVFSGTLGGPIIFEPLTDEISSQGRETLKQLAEVLKGYRNKIEIRGHAAEPRPKEWTEWDARDLSYRRAVFVARELEQNGIDLRRVVLTAVGPNEPVAVGVYDPARLADNRRVEIIVRESLIDDYLSEPTDPSATMGAPASRPVENP